MPELINKSDRVIHIDGAMLIPGESAEVSDKALDHPVVQTMIDQGTLEEPKQKPASRSSSSEGAPKSPAEKNPPGQPAKG